MSERWAGRYKEREGVNIREAAIEGGDRVDYPPLCQPHRGHAADVDCYLSDCCSPGICGR